MRRALLIAAAVVAAGLLALFLIRPGLLFPWGAGELGHSVASELDGATGECHRTGWGAWRCETEPGSGFGARGVPVSVDDTGCWEILALTPRIEGCIEGFDYLRIG